jgi:hypothetical protein
MTIPERRQHLLELVATILLAAAALGTAWSTYQSTTLRGQQSANTSHAIAAGIESSNASTLGHGPPRTISPDRG